MLGRRSTPPPRRSAPCETLDYATPAYPPRLKALGWRHTCKLSQIQQQQNSSCRVYHCREVVGKSNDPFQQQSSRGRQPAMLLGGAGNKDGHVVSTAPKTTSAKSWVKKLGPRSNEEAGQRLFSYSPLLTVGGAARRSSPASAITVRSARSRGPLLARPPSCSPVLLLAGDVQTTI